MVSIPTSVILNVETLPNLKIFQSHGNIPNDLTQPLKNPVPLVPTKTPCTHGTCLRRVTGLLVPAAAGVLLPQLLYVLEVGRELAVRGDDGAVHRWREVVLLDGLPRVRLDDVEGVGEEQVAEEVGRLAW